MLRKPEQCRINLGKFDVVVGRLRVGKTVRLIICGQGSVEKVHAL